MLNVLGSFSSFLTKESKACTFSYSSGINHSHSHLKPSQSRAKPLSRFLSPQVFEATAWRQTPVLSNHQQGGPNSRSKPMLKTHASSTAAPRGHPSKYCPGPMLLNFSVQLGNGVSKMAEPLTLALRPYLELQVLLAKA